jgi:hypothetical protein
MANLANVILTNTDTSTVTFIPGSNQGNLTTWQEDDLTVSTGERQSLSLSLRDGNSASGIKRKVMVKHVTPFRPLDIDGVTQPLEYCEVFITAMVPPLMLDGIDDCVNRAASAMLDAIIIDAYKNGRHPV